jgi:hypothetical protein
VTKDIKICKDSKGLLGVIEKHGESFNVMHVSAGLGKLAKMRGADGTGDQGMLLQQLQDMVRAKMQGMGTREVACILCSMAKLKASGRESVDDEMVGELKARAMAMAGDFEPDEVSNLMTALEEMGITGPDAGLFEAMQARATATAGDFEPRRVANLMLTLARMGTKNLAAGLVEAIQTRATVTAGDFTPKEVVTVMWSLAKMKITPAAGDRPPPRTTIGP